MIIDANEIRAKKLEYDLAIFGAGVAGITIAKELSNAGCSIALLERGGMVPGVYNKEKLNGPLVIMSHTGDVLRTFPNYLSESRETGLGGTSHKWSNYVRELDEIDFKKRDWIPNSGWPFPKSELRPYYDRAYEYVGVIKNTEKLENNICKSKDIREEIYLCRENPIKWSDTHASAALKNVDFIYNYNNTNNIFGKTAVLAMGGVENARMIGSSMFFLEHIHFDIGRARIKNRKKEDLAQYNFMEPQGRSVFLSLTEDAQERRKTLNGQIDLDFIREDGNDVIVRIRYISEHVPAQKNRVTKEGVEMMFSPILWHSMKEVISALREDPNWEITNEINGEFDEKELVKRFYMYPCHHVGTTRMGLYVDNNCMADENIYLAGSSVFPTAGFAAPTLTIVAMSIRLADHLKKELKCSL